MIEGVYFCGKCGRDHKYTSGIGKRHREYAVGDKGILEPVEESPIGDDGVGVVPVLAPPQDLQSTSGQPDAKKGQKPMEFDQGASPSSGNVPLSLEPVDPAVAALMNEIRDQFTPLFDAYEERIRVQERDIVRLQGTVEQLIQAPPAQPPVSSSLGFVKELGINPMDIGKVINQFISNAAPVDQRRERIANKFIDREEALIDARIDQFLEAMYGDKIITVSDKLE